MKTVMCEEVAIQECQQAACPVAESTTSEAGMRCRWSYLAIKRVFDALCSALALAVLSPILLLVAILIKREDGGPVIHTRLCVGDGECTYKMYKFRTMVPDAGNFEKYFTPEQLKTYLSECKLDDDPRITRIGKILRRFSIDELPQLVTVLKGDMSLIGPRPMVAEEQDHFGNRVGEILAVKPGITGYWQVNGRSDCTYESGKRQEMELYYATHCSLWLDIKILFKTVAVVLKGKGAK